MKDKEAYNHKGETMKIELEDDNYKDATKAVERVLDMAMDTLIKRKGYPEMNESTMDGIRQHIIDYSCDCVDAVWDAIKP